MQSGDLWCFSVLRVYVLVRINPDQRLTDKLFVSAFAHFMEDVDLLGPERDRFVWLQFVRQVFNGEI
jgi:hypothetical protein